MELNFFYSYIEAMDANVVEITHHASFVLVAFLIGYFAIIMEEILKLNKAASALIMAIICWTILFLEPAESVERHLEIFTIQMFKVSQVLFFLLGALMIVEVINVHKGFRIITEKLVISNKRMMLWATGFVTFFMSSVLDNLTTTIVMLSLIAKIVDDREDRLYLGGMVVIAANLGGAWTPIGDVATTLLWINGQITTLNVMKSLFLPSIVGLVTSLLLFSMHFRGHFRKHSVELEPVEPYGSFILVLGTACLIFVPVFRILTGLPAFMGMMLGVSIMWGLTDLFHYKYEDRKHLRVTSVLPKVDVSIILFYLGILLSINALESAGLLRSAAEEINQYVASPMMIPVIIGLISSVVDNVSLVAATIGMYDLRSFGVDDPFWQAIAYCAGTGGSIIILGSAAGVALMAIERVSFMWYLRHISLNALAAYAAGIIFYLLILKF